mgnify:CR=1 FL=1
MSMSFKQDDFKQSLVKGLTQMSKNEGPYLVHCVEGKDRTGFVIMILEACPSPRDSGTVATPYMYPTRKPSISNRTT